MQRTWNRPMHSQCCPPLVSVSAYEPSLVDWGRGHVLLLSSIPLTLTIFPPLPWGSPVSEVRNPIETSDLETLLIVWLWASAPAPICCHRKPPQCCLNKALIYEYRSVLLGIISLILFLYFGQFCLVLPSVSGLLSLKFLAIQAM